VPVSCTALMAAAPCCSGLPPIAALKTQRREHGQPERLFAILEDTDSWPEWSAGVQRIEMDGPFIAGTTATIVLPDKTRLRFRVVWVKRGRS
jgi:hypothetical protein